MFRLNSSFKQLATTLEGQAQLQRMTESLEAARPASLNSNMPPPTALPEDIATKLPKGLRVEDLKPPPAKRQKGTGGTPSGSGNVATPEAKTPIAPADSPVPPNSASSKKGGKRKRQESTSRAGAQATPDVKPTPPQSFRVPAPPAKDNALGINLDVAESEVQANAQFFAAYNALRGDAKSSYGGSEEMWANLINAVNQYEADPSNHSVAASDITMALAQAANPSANANGVLSSLTGLNTLGGMSALARGGNEDDLFEQFIDQSKVDDTPSAWTLPTPELFRANSREDDDDSPESIKTVGSTTGMSMKTPVNTTVGLDSVKEGKEMRGMAVLGGYGSPESSAYNGTFFGGWDEDSFNFVTAA